MTEEKTPPEDPPMLVVDLLTSNAEVDRMVEQITKLRQQIWEYYRVSYGLTPAEQAKDKL